MQEEKLQHDIEINLSKIVKNKEVLAKKIPVRPLFMYSLKYYNQHQSQVCMITGPHSFFILVFSKQRLLVQLFPFLRVQIKHNNGNEGTKVV